MIEQFTPYLIFCVALGSGLTAGLFFAFSAFVMSSLVSLPAGHGIAAFQSINISVLIRLFLTVFMGTAFISGLLMVISLLNWGNPNAIYLLAGSFLYLIGSFIVTVACNVPLNNALADVDAGDTGSIALWKDYTSKWTAWNHIRTITSFAAMAAFLLAFG